MSLIDNVPPHNPENEKNVLSAMLIENNAILKVLNILNDQAFYLNLHRKIFKKIQKIFENNIEVDIFILGQEMKGDTEYEDAGGVQYLINLSNYVKTTANVEAHANIVKNLAILRELSVVGVQMTQDALKASADEALEIAQQAYSRISDLCLSANTRTIEQHGKLTKKIYKQIEDLMTGKAKPEGLMTGFKSIDQITTGLKRQNLIVLGARSSMGKTSFALNIAVNVALQKKAALIFSLEMSGEEIENKVISGITEIESWKTRTGKISKTEKEILCAHFTKIAALPLYIDDSTSLTISEIQLKAQSLALELKAGGRSLELIIVDYLQFIKSRESAKLNREREIAQFSFGLKELARKLDVPVIALSQLSRDSDRRPDKKPILSDLRDSGSIGQDADVVMFLHREWYDKREDSDLKNKAIVIIAKHRNGATGEYEIEFIPEITKFRDKNTEAQ